MSIHIVRDADKGSSETTEEYTFPDGKGPPRAQATDENRFVSDMSLSDFRMWE